MRRPGRSNTPRAMFLSESPSCRSGNCSPTALKHSVGAGDGRTRFTARRPSSDLIIGERNGRRMATTRDVLAEERAVIDFAREGRGTCKPFARQHDEFQRDWLNDAQKKAVKHIVESRDRIMLVRGAAGVGKTTMMQEAVEAIEATGTKVFAFAPSADASRGTLREAGFKDADTVARLLLDEKLQQQVAGQLIWIDEAGLLGTKTMAHVFALAEKLDARVLLSGDRYQHGSVERGAALAAAGRRGGPRAGRGQGNPAPVRHLQGGGQGARRRARGAKASSVSMRWAGCGRFPVEERYRQLAADYVEAVADNKTALVVSPTHAEGDRITAEIRRHLHEAGKLGSDERTFRTFENANLTEAERGDAVNYQPGDVLIFHQNAKGFTRGERVDGRGQAATAARPGGTVPGYSIAGRSSWRRATWSGSPKTA